MKYYFFRLCLLIIFFVLADESCNAGELYLVQRIKDEVVSIRQGILNKDGVFVADGVEWSVCGISTERTVSRSIFKNGEKVEPSRYYSGDIAQNPLKSIVNQMANVDISSDSFAESYFKSGLLERAPLEK